MTKKKRTGGRKPGSWTLLTKDDLVQWRKKNKVSRRTLAKAIKSSSTSIQNWEMGKSTPITKFQKRIVESMKNWGTTTAKAMPTKSTTKKVDSRQPQKTVKTATAGRSGADIVQINSERTTGVVMAAQEVRARSVSLFMSGDTAGATALRDMASDLFSRSEKLAAAQ